MKSVVLLVKNGLQNLSLSAASYGNSENNTSALDSSSLQFCRRRLMASARRTKALIESVREATREWLRNAPAARSEIEIDELRKKIRTALVRTEEKGRFVYLRTFYELMKRRNADVLGLEFMMTAIENVMKYASNALKYKDRREYRTIKVMRGSTHPFFHADPVSLETQRVL